MPLVKSNWALKPALAEDGAFEFGRAVTLRHLRLERGSQTRPCFLHVSSEEECRIKALTLITSAEVEVLDVFALLGSLESMDYRKLGTVQGHAMEDGRVFFNVGTAQFPSMWQLQLKLSSRAPALVVHELNVQVDKLGDGNDFMSTTAAAAPSSLLQTRCSSLGSSLNASSTATTMRSTAGTRALGSTTTADFEKAGATTTSLGLSRSRATAAPSSSSLAASSRASASAAPAAAARPAATSTTTALAPIGTGSLTRASSSSANLALRNTRTTTTTALATAGGPSPAETAAVASVLNAVCEKMVGVVSEKTKVYLAKAGKRTERRVLDKMTKLEQRIERFDDVLKHTTASSSELEAALLALDQGLASSPRTPVAT